MNVPRVVLAAGCAVGLVLAGCGGSSSSSTSEPPPTTAATTQSTATTETTATAAAGDAAAGKTVFTASCGGCHTLKDAGSSGASGPNLDDLKPDEARVANQVQNGGGPMPAFGRDGLLSATQVADVAAYVASVAGK